MARRVQIDYSPEYKLNKNRIIVGALENNKVINQKNPDRAPLKEVLGGQYNYREGGRQVLRQGA